MMINKNPDYFLTVAETGSISRAAEKLYVSQPYLSRHIIHLEESLGARLLNRDKVPLQLTPAGEIYVNYLKSTQQMYQKLLLDLKSIETPQNRPLRIGFTNWRAGTLIPEILPAFLQVYPNIRLDLIEVPNSLLYNLVLEDKVDFAIMNTMMDIPEHIVAKTMMYEKILLVGNRNDPIARLLEKSRVAGEPLDLHLIEDARVIMLSPDTALANRVSNFLSSRQILLRNVTCSSNASTALSLTSNNFGFCFLNETGIHSAQNPEDLLFFDLESEDLVYPLCVIYKKESFLTPAVETLISMMIDFYKARYEQALFMS